MNYFVLLCSVAATSVAVAQGRFEGIVTFQVGSGESQMTSSYYFKGNKARWVLPDPRAAAMGGMVIDGDARTVTTIMPEQKMYKTEPLADYHQPVPDWVKPGWKFVKSGSETIAGVPCDEYTVTGPKGQRGDVLCLAHGMGNFLTTGDLSRSYFSDWRAHVPGFAQAMAGGFFPLKIVHADGTTEMLALKVERKPIDDSVFIPPPDYRKLPASEH